MNNQLLSQQLASKPRLRSYSSMNYRQYQDFFGTPPKMPKPPNSKPQEDPIDIPFLCLDTQIIEQTQEENKIQPCRLIYNIQTIPEVDSSDGNSIRIQSHLKKMDNFQQRNQNKMENEGDEDLELISIKRARAKPRSYSENSIFISKSRILDFLNNSHGKYIFEYAGGGRKLSKSDELGQFYIYKLSIFLIFYNHQLNIQIISLSKD